MAKLKGAKMYSAIILDFVGVIADIDIKQLIKDLPIKQKFSGLRVFLTLSKNKVAKGAFNDYQKGLISAEELEQVIAEFCPNSAYIVPIILKNIRKYTFVNEDVLDMAYILRNKGMKVVVMSNSIPETEKIMLESGVEDYVDGIISSCKQQTKKPSPDIFKYAIETYGLDPETTLMIDDTEKNLVVAERFGMHAVKCKTSKSTFNFLATQLQEIDKIERMHKYQY